MLQPAQSNTQKFPPTAIPTYNPVKTVSAPLEQATIGRSVIIKGDISGAEPLFIDGQVEGSITLTDHRVTIGRNGIVTANVSAKEVVIMGKVTGNIECSDRLDIRGEGTLIGDVVTQRISVEDGAMMSGKVQVRAQEKEKAKATAAGANA
jgi:cytoskeletal protein CcmA (bactofilin family)